MRRGGCPRPESMAATAGGHCCQCQQGKRGGGRLGNEVCHLLRRQHAAEDGGIHGSCLHSSSGGSPVADGEGGNVARGIVIAGARLVQLAVAGKLVDRGRSSLRGQEEGHRDVCRCRLGVRGKRDGRWGESVGSSAGASITIGDGKFVGTCRVTDGGRRVELTVKGTAGVGCFPRLVGKPEEGAIASARPVHGQHEGVARGCIQPQVGDVVFVGCRDVDIRQGVDGSRKRRLRLARQESGSDRQDSKELFHSDDEGYF